MQRIDENTYIDDTLVTCAEYQLFIDEMREQGKYYQPDHWLSYQFPEGQALKPILGIRFSDAAAFCEWLTKQENEEWHYRLLTQEEVKHSPMVSNQSLLHFGYWIKNTENQARFAWIGSIPIDPRRIGLTLINHLNFARDFTRDFDTLLNHALSNNLPLNLDLLPNREIMQAVGFVGFIRGSTLSSYLNNARNLAVARDFQALPAYINRARNIVFRVNRTPNSDLEHDLNLNPIIKLTLNLYIDLFTLEERIAGRSPAFEGIRLVKERTR